jgi:hypothetical protein
MVRKMEREPYPDHITSDLQRVNSWLQVAQNPQVGCESYADPPTIITSSSRLLLQDEAFQDRSVRHFKLLHPGKPKDHGPEALAAEMEALALVVIPKCSTPESPRTTHRKGLQNGAESQQCVQVLFANVNIYQFEHPELRKNDVRAAGEVAGELPQGQGEASERRAAEDLGRKARGVRLDLADLVVEGEFLQGALAGEEARPRRVQGGEPAVTEADGAEGARMLFQEPSDGGSGTRGHGEVERHRCRQREARTEVRAASVKGRWEMIWWRRSSWRPLSRSLPPWPAAAPVAMVARGFWLDFSRRHKSESVPHGPSSVQRIFEKSEGSFIVARYGLAH